MMRILTAMFPLLIVPFALILLQKHQLLVWTASEFYFMFVIALLIIVSMAIEMLKATIYAPAGATLWLDFTLSLLVMIGILVYMILTPWDYYHYPLMLVLTAAVADVVVGFYISIANARRDFNTGSHRF